MLVHDEAAGFHKCKIQSGQESKMVAFIQNRKKIFFFSPGPFGGFKCVLYLVSVDL